MWDCVIEYVYNCIIIEFLCEFCLIFISLDLSSSCSSGNRMIYHSLCHTVSLSLSLCTLLLYIIIVRYFLSSFTCLYYCNCLITFRIIHHIIMSSPVIVCVWDCYWMDTLSHVCVRVHVHFITTNHLFNHK